MTAETWDNGLTKSFGMLLDGRAQVTGLKRPGADASMLAIFNAHHDVVEFTLPATPELAGWNRLMDTNDPELPAETFEFGAVYEVTGRSMVLFERVTEQPRSCAVARQVTTRYSPPSRAAFPLHWDRAGAALDGSISRDPGREVLTLSFRAAIPVTWQLNSRDQSEAIGAGGRVILLLARKRTSD